MAGGSVGGVGSVNTGNYPATGVNYNLPTNHASHSMQSNYPQKKMTSSEEELFYQVMQVSDYDLMMMSEFDRMQLLALRERLMIENGNFFRVLKIIFQQIYDFFLKLFFRYGTEYLLIFFICKHLISPLK